LLKELAKLFIFISKITKMDLEKINQIQLFDNNIETLIREKIDSITKAVAKLDIHADLTDEQIDTMINDLFKKLWNWSDLQSLVINREAIKSDSREVLLHPDDALEILYPRRNSIDYTYHKVSKIIYSIPISGYSTALEYSTLGNDTKFMGDLTHDSLIIYLYTDKEINEELGSQMRVFRDRILDKIDNTLKSNNNYLIGISEHFKRMIEDSIRQVYVAEKKRKHTNSYL